LSFITAGDRAFRAHGKRDIPDAAAAVLGDPGRMDAHTDTRLRLADLGGLITWGIGLGLLLAGFLADSSSDGVAGGPGLTFYLLASLAMFAGICWSLSSMAVAVVRLARGRDRGASLTTLWLNATTWCGTAIVISTVWVLNVS
jgi:hypothetical protein